MRRRFSKGLYCNPAFLSKELLPKNDSANNELLILILLFVLLAASPSLGLESRYFFIIILAVIGLGGVNKAFGLK